MSRHAGVLFPSTISLLVDVILIVIGAVSEEQISLFCLIDNSLTHSFVTFQVRVKMGKEFRFLEAMTIIFW